MQDHPVCANTPGLARHVASLSKSAGLVEGTRSYYRTGVRRFGKWVGYWKDRGCRIRFLCPSEITLCLFVVFLSLSLAPGTIRNYLFGIRDFHLGRGYSNPLVPAICLWRVMGALYKACGTPRGRRRPVTVHSLGVFFGYVDFSLHDSVVLWSMCTVGVYALLRIGELAPSRDEYKVRKTGWRSAATLAAIKLPKHKSDQLNSVKIILTAIDNWSCPISNTNYMLKASSDAAKKSPFLWALEDGSPATSGHLIAFVRRLCIRCGLNPDDYNGISFRKGGALSLSLAGVDEQVIRAMGRWKGAVMDRYIENVVVVVRRAQTAAGTLWSHEGGSERCTADDLWDRL